MEWNRKLYRRGVLRLFAHPVHASMGAVLLGAGADGKRSALPNSRIMIHQPLGGTQGQASDIEIYTKEMLKTREQLNGILAHHTRQPLERIERDTDRNFFMSAEEAKDYGIVDHVINKRAEYEPAHADARARAGPLT